jgi:hypothetical protein
MKKILCVLLIAVIAVLAGCANYKDTNQMIADANKEKFSAFAAGMAACNGDAACQVALSMAYSSNIGQQNFYKPETAKDWVTASVPLASLFLQGYQIYKGTGNSSGDGITINGDGNSVSGVGNKYTASDNSSITESLSSSSSFNYEIANRKYSLGTDASGGTATIDDDGVSIIPTVQ